MCPEPLEAGDGVLLLVDVVLEVLLHLQHLELQPLRQPEQEKLAKSEMVIERKIQRWWIERKNSERVDR